MAHITASSREERLGARGVARGGRALPVVLDRAALLALLALLTAYTAVFTAMALARLDVFRQGFDLVSYVQPIWNTSQGRPFEQSVYAGTRTILGVDLFLIEGLLALPYALFPGYATLFGLLAAVTALGGLAVYRIAEDALASRPAALLAGCLYLFNLTIQSVTPYEFRPRLIAATALLFAYWLQQRGRAGPFWLALAVALSVRLDVALAVAMLGLVGLLQRRPWPFGLAPLVVGLGYWLLGLLVIVPALRGGESFLFLFYFAWLGDTPAAILTTLLTRPGYVLAGVLTAEKLRYTLLLLWPVAGLALLRPLLLLPALPVYAINLLGGERTQIRIDYDYSVLIVPWLVVAAVLAAGDLVHGRGWAGRALAAAGRRLGAIRQRWPAPAGARPLLAAGLTGLLLLATLSQHAVATTHRQVVGAPSPLVEYLRGYRPYERAAAARQVLEALPRSGPVAVTSELAPHVPLRRQLYYFPGNRAYSPALVEQARWVIGDRRRTLGERAAVERLLAGGAWRKVLDVDDYVLLERIR